MVEDYTTIKDKIKESLINLEDKPFLTKDFEGTYLFFSFDLVNSTAFKNRNKQWGKLFDGFVSQSKILMEQEFHFIKIWKMVGDEILFYMQVTSIDDLHFAPKKTYDVLQKCIKFIEEKDGVKSNLSIKATIWSAVVYDSEDKNTENCDNIIIKERDVDGYTLDFLGLDIDTGFRISKFVIGSVLVVDAKLACLITDLEKEMMDKHISNFMRIVSYQQLKGVWDNRHYPIVWYRNEWSDSKDMFVYDERYNSEIVKQICDTKGECLDDVSLLKKIFEDLDKLNVVKNLKEKIIKEANPILISKIPKDKLCEMHVVAICVNSNNEILIAKRAADKNTFPNIWEFGCSQLRLNQDFISAINKDYNNDFGIKLKLLKDEPIATYTIGKLKDSRVVPGLIFLCRIEENENAISLDDKKHSDCKFINKENYKNINRNETIPDFHKRIEDAYKSLELLAKEESDDGY
jgi:isopentenyldiphosphate isomerase